MTDGTATAGAVPERALAVSKKPEFSILRALWRGIRNNAPPFILLAIVWESVVQMNVFPRVLMPSLAEIGATFWRLASNGTLFYHIGASSGRLLVGFAVGSAIGIFIGLIMGQYRLGERFFLPLLSALMPIPALAWIPLFVLWFGLGNKATLAVIIFAASLPVAFNTWTGVKTVSPILIRAAESMGCRGRMLFPKVIFPASLAMIFAGLRIGLSQSWRALVAGEMLAATAWGLGFAIFDAREFLATDVMLVMVLTIGFVGFFIVVVLFSMVEKHTVVKWGMLKGELGV
jgi:NitT/TauT family transport system permease protein